MGIYMDIQMEQEVDSQAQSIVASKPRYQSNDHSMDSVESLSLQRPRFHHHLEPISIVIQPPRPKHTTGTSSHNAFVSVGPQRKRTGTHAFLLNVKHIIVYPRDV